jgi:tetratricopeptide (TPR) repeat protein
MSEVPQPSERDTPPEAMAFISYSRTDHAFVDRLEQALQTRNIRVLLDRSDIEAFEDWWQRIENLIGQADAIVFVLSPDALASAVCTREVAFATSLNKRLAPIACRPVDDGAIPSALARLNIIFFGEPERFEQHVDQLAQALTTDIAWIRRHTEFGEAARRWSPDGRPGPGGLLLRPPVLEEAEGWIASRPQGAPVPTPATQAFIAESRRAATRRRNMLTGSLAAGLALALGLAGLAYWQRGVAVEQRSIADAQRGIATLEAGRAERNFGAAKSTIDTVIFDLAQGLQDVEGMRVETARRILEQAERAIGELASRTENDPEVRRSQGYMFNLFSGTYLRLGGTDLALDYARKAADMLRDLVARDPDNLDKQRDLSISLDRVGEVLKEQGEIGAALDAYRESLAIRRALVSKNPGDTLLAHDLFVSLISLADGERVAGDLAAALGLYSEAFDIITALVARDSGNTEWRRDLSTSLAKIGDGYSEQGNLERALDAYRKSLDIARALVALDPGNTQWQRDLSVSLVNLGDALEEQKDLPGALAAYRESLDIMRRLAAKDPANTEALRGVQVSLGNIADVLKLQGELAAAIATYRESLDIVRKLVAKDPGNSEWQRDLTVNLNNLGDALKSQGDLAGAVAAYQESLEVRRRRAAADPGNARAEADVVLALWRLARAGDDARGRLTEALMILARLDAENRLTPVERGYIAALQAELARAP